MRPCLTGLQQGGVLGSKNGFLSETSGVSKAWAQGNVTIGVKYVCFQAFGVILSGTGVTRASVIVVDLHCISMYCTSSGLRWEDRIWGR